MNDDAAPLRPPGPPCPWWGLPRLRAMSRDYLGEVCALRRDHGDVTFMQIGKEPVYDVFDPALVREALVDQADHLVRWEHGIEVFEQSFGQSVLVTEGATWQRQRRMLMPGFTPRRVQGYAALMSAAARSALDAAMPPDATSADVDIAALMSRLAMDVILRTLFSQPDRGESQAAAKATQVLSQRAMREMVWPVTLHGLVDRHIAARHALPAGEAPRDDLLAMLLSVRDDETGAGL